MCSRIPLHLPSSLSWYHVYDHTVDFRYENINNLNPLEACQLTINQITKNYAPPYYIMVSGGIDSQAMLYAWLKFGNNFIPTCFLYNDDLNHHDISTLKIFAEKYNIDVNYIDIDIIQFIDNNFREYAEKYKCSSPWITSYIYMSEKLNGTVIFSGNFLQSKNGPANSLTYSILGLYRASLSKNNLIPYFFLHSPELAYSFRWNKTNLATYLDKVNAYRRYGFPVLSQTEKITGFEKIKDIYDLRFKYKITGKDILKYQNRISGRPTDIILRYPYEEKFGGDNVKIIINENILC